jgi:phosphoribosylglycinamide formyltransferase-1
MVNEEYDKGRILLQKEVEVLPDDSPESLAAKVLKLEHLWFPRVIESLIKV